MSTNERYRSLVDLLYANTTFGSTKWEYSYSDDLECKQGGYIIRLSSFTDEVNEPIEQIQILKPIGTVIDTFTDVDLVGLLPKDAGISGYYEKMNKLRNMARRQALGADEALDKILKSLDDEIPF